MTKKKEKAKELMLPIKWNVPDDIITRYATHIVVQRVSNGFKILLFEIKHNINFDLTLPKEIQADCVASVIIPEGKFQNIINHLQEQFDLK